MALLHFMNEIYYDLFTCGQVFTKNKECFAMIDILFDHELTLTENIFLHIFAEGFLHIVFLPLSVSG